MDFSVDKSARRGVSYMDPTDLDEKGIEAGDSRGGGSASFVVGLFARLFFFFFFTHDILGPGRRAMS